MLINKIPSGDSPPDEINVIIEIPGRGSAVKYEIDKESGALFVDRFMMTSMSYPFHYGFIPNTLSDDGDPCDVLVMSDTDVVPGSVIKSRPVAVLLMEDESGFDEKILAVPTTKLHPLYKEINTISDVPELILERIRHFFENYKALEKGKWVKVIEWQGAEKAKDMILESIDRFKKNK